VRDLPRRQLAKGDARRLVLDDLPARSEQTEAGDDGVRLPGQPLQHPLGLRHGRRLAEDRATDLHRRVDAEHGPVRAAQVRDRPRLAARMLADEVVDICVRRVVLVVLGRDDVEREVELLEDRAPLRARRREQDRVDDVRAHR
jgi:hypothetical protein